MTKKREHHPLCDVSLGPDFEVGAESVTMSIGICWNYECQEEYADTPT